MKHNWTYKKLGDVGQVITGSTPTTKDERNYSSKDVCFFKPSDFSSEKLTELTSSEFYISSYAYEHSRKLPKDSVLTTCIGIIGKVGILTADATCNQQINAIIPNKEIIVPRFLGYSIISIKGLLSERANAPVVSLLNKSQFSSIEIPIPSLSEQESIVAELDAINHLIDLQEQQLCEYDRLAQSLFYTTFGDPTTNPKGWEKVRVDSICKNLDNRRKPVTASERVPGDIPYYGASGVVDYVRDYIFDGDYLLVSEDGANLVARVTPIAFSISGKTWVNNHAHILEFSEPSTQLYVQMHLNLIDLSGLITGAVQPKLNQAMLNGYMLPLPPLELQQTFAAQIEAIEQQKALIRRSLDETRTLLAARMQYYFE